MNSAYSPKPRTATSKAFSSHYPIDINFLVSSLLGKTQSDSSRLYYETSDAHMAIDSLADYVIGSGLVPTASPEKSIVKWSEAERKAFCQEAESYWRIVTGSHSIDHYGKNTFKDLQKIAFKNILIQGDVLLHIYYKGKNFNYMPTVQIMSGQWVRNPMNHPDTKEVSGGVVFDSHNRERGYYIAKTNDRRQATYECDFVEKYNKAGMKEFELIKIGSSEANQVRGIPLLTPCRDDILNLEVAKTNHITKFIIETLLTVFITSPEGSANATDTLETIRSLGSQGSEDTDFDKDDYVLGAGNILTLQPGEKAESIQPSQASLDFAQLHKTILSSIGGAIGVPYEMLLKQYGSSYSASRATIQSASKHFADIREEFADKFCQEVYDIVIDYGIRSGYINAPGYLEGSREYRDAVLAATWIGPAPVIMNPVDEANAQQLMVAWNFTTAEKATRDLTGMDYEEVLERRAYEEELKRNLMGAFTSNNEEDKEENENEEKEEGDDNE